MVKKRFKVIPYGAREDTEDNEWIYYDLGIDQDKNKPALTMHPTFLYPYAFVFLPKNGDGYAFVYHVLVRFDNMLSKYVLNDNSIEAMDDLAVSVNTMKMKSVLVKHLKNELERKLEKFPSVYKNDIEVKKCIKYCKKYLEDYENASFDCDRLRIVPMHINGRSDINVPVESFGIYDTHTYAGKDEKRVKALYDASHEWNVRTIKGVEIELDWVMTMTWDILSDCTATKHKNKSITQELKEKGVTSYDLYTFVVKEENERMIGTQYSVYNVFWDGDGFLFDDSEENLDSMLYENEGIEGFRNFVKFMNHNKFLPRSMLDKWNEYASTNSATVVGVYRAYFRDCIMVDYDKAVSN